jgi:hypothetical protein
VFSVVSQKTAAGYELDRSKLQTPIMVDGPSNQQVRATELCTIALPQEKAVGGKMIIYAYVVDTLEECYETPGDGLQRWQMQLGEEEGYLRWLQVAQPGDHPHYELTLEETSGAELPETRRSDQHQGLGDRVEISLQRGAGQERWVERDPQTPRPHSAAKWERWYLNLHLSETARRSRITLAAAAKPGRGSMHDKRMHLRDVNRIEVSITVDVVDTTRELMEGKDSLLGAPKPHMVLTPGDERHIQGMMLTGWMGKADLLTGWASQGKRKGQPASEAGGKRSRGAGVLQAPQGED